jgi:GNAT superfamily N-acetyltransferase
MSQRLTVRLVAPIDLDQWEALWEGYNTFYERTVPPEITRMTWSRFYDASEPVHALVAEKDRRRSTSLLGPTCYLQDLFTTEEARGQGVGRALIEVVSERDDKVAERSGFLVYRKRL